MARSTIQDNLKRAAAAGLKWPSADDVTDDAPERQLFERAGIAQGQRRWIEPDWAELARELKHPGVTMTIVWKDYAEAHLEDCGYSRFYDLLRGLEIWPMPVIRQRHVAGEKMFLDYSGKRSGLPSQGDCKAIVRPRPPKSARRRFWSPSSAPRTSPVPRRPGRRSCRIEPAPMCTCSVSGRCAEPACSRRSRAASSRPRSATRDL